MDATGYENIVLDKLRPEIDYQAQENNRSLSDEDIRQAADYLEWLSDLSAQGVPPLTERADAEIKAFKSLLPKSDIERVLNPDDNPFADEHSEVRDVIKPNPNP
jgi:hypothetical protein